MEKDHNTGRRAFLLLAEPKELAEVARQVEAALGGLAFQCSPLEDIFAGNNLDKNSTLILALTASSVHHPFVAEIWRQQYVQNAGFRQLIPIWLEQGDPPPPWSEVMCILRREACDEATLLTRLLTAGFVGRTSRRF